MFKFSVDSFTTKHPKSSKPSCEIYLGVSKNSGTPKWMVYRENPIRIDDLGYHYFWKHPFGFLKIASKRKPSFEEVFIGIGVFRGRPPRGLVSEMVVPFHWPWIAGEI